MAENRDATARAVSAELDAEHGHDNALAAAYRAGWMSCARWARRDDLNADTDSPAYKQERDTLLGRIALTYPD